MKKVPFTITFASLYLLFFLLAPFIGVSSVIIDLMFLLSPLLVIAMVIIVLKYGTPSKHTFKERFYDDLDYERYSGEGLDR